MADRPLTDNQVHDLLCKAHEALDGELAETLHGSTAIEAAKKMLKLIQYSLVAAMVKR